MTDLAEILPSRIAERLETLGKSKRGLSLAIGGHAGYIRDLFDADRFNVPSAVRLEAIARELETTTDYLMGTSVNPGIVRSEVSVLADRRFAWRAPSSDEPGIPLVGTGDCADLELEDMEGGRVSIERASFDPDYHVTYIARPPALLGDREAYAIYFHGASMEPRFFAGEVGIVQPTRPAGPGDFVVVQLCDGASDDVTSVLVKRLVRIGRNHVELEQFNPAVTFRLPRAQVRRIHRIMSPSDLLL